MKFEIVFENEDYVAFNKPAGLLSVPDRFNLSLPNMYNEANKTYGKLWMVHRLDKETSGIICFAKNEEAHRHLSQLFQHREVAKFYSALVNGKPLNDKGSIRNPIGANPSQKGRMSVQKRGKPAHTDYSIISSWKSYSLLKLQLFTGRTHQIRVHTAFIGHPVVCDSFYGSGDVLLLSSFKKRFNLSEKEDEERPLLNRLALHSTQLIFKDEKGIEINIEAPLPKDLRAAVNQLDKWNK